MEQHDDMVTPSDQNSPNKTRLYKPFLVVALVLLLGALLIGGYFIFARFMPQQGQKMPVTSTPLEAPKNDTIPTNIDQPTTSQQESGEKIIFYSREGALGQPNRYHIYSMGLDGRDKKEILTYGPNTSSLSVISKFGADKINIYRLHNDTDIKVFDTYGKELTSTIQPSVFVYTSPDQTRVMSEAVVGGFTIYDLPTNRSKNFTFPKEFQKIDEIVANDFIDNNHVVIGSGDLFAVEQGLVEFNFEKGTAILKDSQSYSALGESDHYITKNLLLVATTNSQEDSIIPPADLYAINLNTKQKTKLFHADKYVLGSISMSPDRNRFAYGTDTSKLIVGEINNANISNVREINLTQPAKANAIFWTHDNKKILYQFDNSNQGAILDLESGQSNAVSNLNPVNGEIVGIFAK